MIMILTAPREVALDIHVGLVADGDAAGGIGRAGEIRSRSRAPPYPQKVVQASSLGALVVGSQVSIAIGRGRHGTL